MEQLPISIMVTIGVVVAAATMHLLDYYTSWKQKLRGAKITFSQPASTPEVQNCSSATQLTGSYLLRHTLRIYDLVANGNTIDG
jgi:hypothetical protein